MSINQRRSSSIAIIAISGYALLMLAGCGNTDEATSNQQNATTDQSVSNNQTVPTPDTRSESSNADGCSGKEGCGEGDGRDRTNSEHDQGHSEHS